MRRAAVDIGSNTVRLLVLDEDGSDLERRYVVTGLGRGVDASRRFRADAVEQSLAVLTDYREILDRYGRVRLRAVATSATRDADDGEDFLDAVAGVLGIRPEVISGGEEAALAFIGGTRGGLGPAPILVIDVGGGSTELVYGSEGPDYATSVDIGSVRITDRVLPDRPAGGDQVAAARAEADRLFAGVELPGPVATAVGIDGTFTTMATLIKGMPHWAAVHGVVLTGDDVAVLIDRLAGLSIEGIAALEGIDPVRAPVILGGAIVAERAMTAARIGEVVVAEHDLLDGIALSVGENALGD